MVLGTKTSVVDADIIQSSATQNLTTTEDWLPDQQLKDILTRQLGTEVTQQNIQNITSLNLSYENVTNLKGLEYATNLQSLDLSGSNISDLTPLQNLHQLIFLNLRLNKASTPPDLAPIENLKLQSLNLLADDYGNYVSRIMPIRNMTTLSSLELGDNALNDLNIIQNLKNLTYLSLSQNNLQNLDGLSQISNIETLRLGYNKLSNIDQLSKMKHLKYLSLGDNSVSDLTPLKNISTLQELALSQMSLTNTNLNSLSNLSNLTKLSIDFNDKITSLTALTNLTNLQQLDFSKTSVSDLSPVSSLKNLTNLSFSNASVSDISPLRSLNNLTTLNMLRNHIYDISPLAQLKKLVTVNAKYQTVILPNVNYTSQGETLSIPFSVVDNLGIVLPLTYSSGINADSFTPGAIKIYHPKEDGSAYFSWDNSTSSSTFNKFNGTVEQPVTLSNNPYAKEKVTIAILKGDGSGYTSVASNFIQKQATIITDPVTNKKSLEITAVVPKEYGENSILFQSASKTETSVVGNTLHIISTVPLTAHDLQSGNILETIHVNIASLSYNHIYQIYIAINSDQKRTSDPNNEDTQKNAKSTVTSSQINSTKEVETSLKTNSTKKAEKSSKIENFPNKNNKLLLPHTDVKVVEISGVMAAVVLITFSAFILKKTH